MANLKTVQVSRPNMHLMETKLNGTVMIEGGFPLICYASQDRFSVSERQKMVQ